MTIKQKEVGSVTVISMTGDVLGGPDAAELNELLHRLVKEGKKNAVINLANVEYMNSSGLGMMTAALTTMRNAGGSLKLANSAERIKSLLVITKLSSVFQSFDSVDDAVKSFN
jgi:anti-sigma B factor antagonist